MKLAGRIDALERRTAVRRELGDGLGEFLRRREASLSLVPEDLRAAVESRLRPARAVQAETFSSWLHGPFARWAPAPAAGYRFPRSMVAWMLDPPRRFWMGHHCGRCGLCVPLYATWSNDPDPPPVLGPFPACPACGGATSHAAFYRPHAAEAA